MAITPSTDIYLVQCPLESDNLNQLTFANAQAQFDYFNMLASLPINNTTYQRANNYIRVPHHIDMLLNYNYVMYRNELYSNKWFYAFIEKMEYINDNMTLVYIKQDSFQTWYFDITIKESFVEREHVNDDTLGSNTYPEELETGPYISNGSTSLYEGGNTTYPAVATSYVPDTIGLNTLNTQYGGVYSGTPILVFDSPLAVSNFLRGMDALDKSEAVTSVFMIPSGLMGNVQFQTKSITISGHSYTFSVAIPEYTTGETNLGSSTAFTAPTSLDSYNPVNNKLRVWPYSYFYVSNNLGTDIEYHYEDFHNGSVQFKTIGVLSQGCSIKCYPLNHKRIAQNYNEGIVVGKYPICSWKSDSYTNWLTENGLNNIVNGNNALSSIINAVAPTANTLHNVLGFGRISGMLGSIYQHSLIPPQAKGSSNSGDITFSSKRMNIPVYKMCIRNEYAEKIDNYFSTYGYKVCNFKVPNITGRLNWNYVKTVDINIEGEIPQEDMREIKSIFDNGVTLWHNPNTFLDYSQSNVII